MAFQRFPLDPATTLMANTPVWVISVTFGRLLREIVPMPGTGLCITIFQMCTGTSAVSTTALVFVAWGISPVDYLTIWGYGVKLHRKYISLKPSEFSGGFCF